MKLVLLSLVCSVFSAELPPFIKKCPAGDPFETRDCIIDQIPTVLSHLKAGYPPFDIPPLDPLLIPTLNLTFMGERFATMTDVNVSELTNAIFSDFYPEFDPKNELNNIHTLIDFPELRIEGIADAKELFLDPNGNKAPIKLELYNSSMDIRMFFSTEEKNDKRYYVNEKDFDAIFEIRDVNINTTIGEEKKLKHMIASIVNVKELDGIFQLFILPAVRDVVNGILSKLLQNVEVENFFA